MRPRRHSARPRVRPCRPSKCGRVASPSRPSCIKAPTRPSGACESPDRSPPAGWEMHVWRDMWGGTCVGWDMCGGVGQVWWGGTCVWDLGGTWVANVARVWGRTCERYGKAWARRRGECGLGDVGNCVSWRRGELWRSESGRSVGLEMCKKMCKKMCAQKLRGRSPLELMEQTCVPPS